MEEDLAYEYDPRLDWRQEMIDGKIRMMAPASSHHNVIAGNIHGLLWSFLRGKPCQAFVEGPAVHLTEKNYFVPDVSVVCDHEKLKGGKVYGAPDLVVEVLSPSTARYDRGRKMEIYEESGVREYWMVEPQGRSIEQYVLEEGRFRFRTVCTLVSPERLSWLDPEERERIQTEFSCAVFPELTIRVDEVFENLILE